MQCVCATSVARKFTRNNCRSFVPEYFQNSRASFLYFDHRPRRSSTPLIVLRTNFGRIALMTFTNSEFMGNPYAGDCAGGYRFADVEAG